MTTPIYALPDWAAAMASPWNGENQAKRILEAVARGSVLDRDLTAPPGTCDDGAAYLVGGAATGAWATHDGEMAVAVGTDAANGWLFVEIATEGKLLYVEDEATLIQYVSAAWVEFEAGGGSSGGGGLAWKVQVRAASTSAGTLASDFEDGDSLDGVTLATGDRILIKDQASAEENGIYVVEVSGAPTRATDADSEDDLFQAAVFVSEGTANSNTQWSVVTPKPIVPDTTPLTFARIGSGGRSVGALLKRTSSLSVGSVPVFPVNFQTADFDDLGFWSGGAPSRLTIPPGISRCRLSAGINPDSDYAANSTMFLVICKNGDSSNAGRVAQIASRADGFSAIPNMIVSPWLNVVAGDYFEVRLNTSGDTNFTVLAEPTTHFSIEAS